MPAVFWFWWNAIGGVVTLSVAYIASLFLSDDDNNKTKNFAFSWELDTQKAVLLISFFVAIVLFSMHVDKWF